MDDKRLERIELKLDDIADNLGSIDVTIAKQEISLTEHIRRTAILEKKIEPIEKHVTMIQGGIKLLTLMGIIAAIISTVLKLLKVL